MSRQQAALMVRIIDQDGRKALNKFLLLFQYHCQTPQCAVPVWSFANAAFQDASKGELLIKICERSSCLFLRMITNVSASTKV